MATDLPTYTPPPRLPAKKGHIMVVEDSPDQWELLKAAAEQTMPDVELVWFPNTHGALTYLNACVADKQPLPKLLLLDLYVPDARHAWELLQTIKQPDSPFLWMPVVLISNSEHPENINNFYAFGGTSYIVKPSTYEQWVDYLQTVRQYWWETVTLPSGRGQGV